MAGLLLIVGATQSSGSLWLKPYIDSWLACLEAKPRLGFFLGTQYLQDDHEPQWLFFLAVCCRVSHVFVCHEEPTVFGGGLRGSSSGGFSIPRKPCGEGQGVARMQERVHGACSVF